MSYQEKIDRACAILEEHNANLPQDACEINIELFVLRLKINGVDL